MPVDIATIGAFGGLLMPVYIALWKVNGDIGEIRARTAHNEQSVEDIGDTVARIEGEVRSNSQEIEQKT